MSWFSELAGKAETLLNNIDERTATVLNNPNLRQTRRPFTRTQTKKLPINETRSTYSPTRKAVTPIRLIQKDTKSFDSKKETKTVQRKPVRRNQYDLNQPPHTLVNGDAIMMHYDKPYSQRRKSLPNNNEIVDLINEANKGEMHDVEFEMLKNEVAMSNQEVSVLIDKLKAAEDELKESDKKYTNVEKLYNNLKEENKSLMSEMSMLKEKLTLQTISSPEYNNLSKSYQVLEEDFSKISETNRQLQERLRDLEMNRTSNASIQIKLENDLRFAHNTISELKSDLEKARNDCQRIQDDWDSYKLRVKSMLLSKDKEIQALQQGPGYSESTKLLVEQVESLREERVELSTTVARMQSECAEGKSHMEKLEGKLHAADRLVVALREALREERMARNKAENECVFINKGLKNLQMESSHQIANLRSALREKEHEIKSHLAMCNHSLTSVCQDTSALNVAEHHNRIHDSISSEKVQVLTQSLVSKQGRIDTLLSENNTLKLQIEKIQAQHRKELSAIQSNHRVIQVNDGDAVLKTRIGGRGYVPGSTISKISLQIGVFMRRHPLFRLFIVLYMVGLHLWVLVVLLTYTPEVHPVDVGPGL